MAQDRMLEASPVSEAQTFKATSKSRTQNLGDEDQILRVDPYFDKWYVYDEAAEPILPPDFSERLGIHIIVLMERHTTNDALKKIGELLERHITNPKMYVVFLKTLRLFLHRTEALPYLNNIWQSILHGYKPIKAEESHLMRVLSWLYKDFLTNRNRNHYIDRQDPAFNFSFLAHEIGDNLICLNEFAGSIDNIRTLYSMVINMELEDLDINQEMDKKGMMVISGNYEDSYKQPHYSRYLFNDILQYVEYRASDFGQKQYGALGISHQAENIKYLCRVLSSVRSQVVQTIIGNKAVKRNKSIKEKLKNRVLTDEEIIASTPLFKDVLHSFYIEKRYRFDYISLDIVRNFCRLFAVICGFSAVLYSFLDTSFMGLVEGVAILVTMSVFALAVFAKKYFKSFYPSKRDKEFYSKMNEYLTFFKKMERDQLLDFGEKQLRDPDNKKCFYIIPELIIQLHYYSLGKTEKIIKEKDIYYVANYLQKICDMESDKTEQLNDEINK